MAVAFVATALLSGASPVLANGEIAVVGPMTGRYATLGAAMRAALHPRDVNAVTFEDDGCQADMAVVVAQRLVAAKAYVVIGHPCSSAAIAAAPIYAAAGIPLISTGARHPDLTDKRAGPLVFRLSGRDDRQGAVAAAFLADVAGDKPIAILHDRTLAMSTIAAAAAAALGADDPPASTPAAAESAAAPSRPVTQFPFVASELNYDALAARVAALAPGGDVGAVLFAGYPEEAVIVVRALRAHGVSAPILGVDALATTEFGRLLAQRDTEVFVLMSPDAAGPEDMAARTASVVGMWLEARTHNAEPATVATRTIDGPAAGRVAFDTKGDAVLPSYVVSAWRAGAWQPVPSQTADR